MTENFDIVVFSHLRWEFVWQRPQHILQRLAKSHRVLFVEEPIAYSVEEKGSARVFTPEKNVTVLQPKISWESFPQRMVPMLLSYIRSVKMNKPVLWFYSAEFVDVIDELPHSLIVYDCMDELTAFKDASPLLAAQERYLMESADVMFTGGKSLYESKRQFHSNVFCFPSSVDQKHFHKALRPDTPLPRDISQLPKPIVGFYGVIDERLDTHLLKEVAGNMPHVSFVLIGPVVKIRPEDLPHLPNIYYLGSRKYEQLPAYLKAFDIAMMPFALNEATRFISPTKTLEFMAALKPIISTPIYDVKYSYAKGVAVVQNTQQFVARINHYLHETTEQKNRREALQKKIIAQTSWTKTVQAMNAILLKHICQAKNPERTSTWPQYLPLSGGAW